MFGDVFLTEAVAVLKEVQNRNRDQLYLYSNYDPQPYYPKLLDQSTFANQIRCQLYTALEEHNKLPAVILIVLGNKKIDDMVFNPENTRKVWRALFTELQRAIRVRKEDLPKKAQIDEEPRVLIGNIFPRFKDHQEKTDKTHESFKTKRRRLNGMLPQIAHEYDFTILPISGILPDNAEFFTTTTGQLNGKGMKEFWVSLSKELRLDDIRREERKKNKIIQEYFDEQREIRKGNIERKKIARERLSLPRSMGPREFDRGDGNFRRNQHQTNRARSVPNARIDSGRSKNK